MGHGRAIEPRHVVGGRADGGSAAPPEHGDGSWVRLMSGDGRLVAMAEATATGALHPSIVLI